MSTCMGIGDPLVSIVLAVYNPQMDWFFKQLESLNRQTYANLELLIVDDCSSEVSLQQIEETVQKTITQIPYSIMQNKENLGSNKTFEKLTLASPGRYIAYCDQDDIWENDKISILVEIMENSKALLLCSDVRVIDKDDKVIAESITKVRKRHLYKKGDGLVQTLLSQNFIIGCTMLIRADVAKAAVPFLENMVHDHYLALFAANRGEIEVCSEPLVRYRLHGDNQTEVMTGVKTKEDYYKYRIKTFLDRLLEIEKKEIAVDILPEAIVWAKARDKYFNGDWASAKTLWKYRYFDKLTTIFEISILKMPQCVFAFTLNLIKRGIL